uniref:Uncharacterized protein n=1 Tax=Arundo donax TaxID=35708 RepID=A0A0A9THS7_ARUDO
MLNPHEGWRPGQWKIIYEKLLLLLGNNLVLLILAC